MAVKTPTIRPDRIRNDAMYCATRSVITRQPAITTTTVISAVSSTIQIDSPSMPR
jgi:hypothetical protein